MFEIPEDLPLRLGALAWLVGHWQGWGMQMEEVLPSPDSDGEDSDDTLVEKPIIQDVEAQIVGEQLRMRISNFAAHYQGEVDPMWTAEEALEHLEPGELLREETLYWNVTSPLAVMPIDPDETRELRAVSSDTEGFAVLWAGVAMGPRLRLESDGVARSPDAKPVDHFSRMFGLVAGELMWASEAKIGEEDFEVEFSARLQRVTSSGGVDVAD